MGQDSPRKFQEFDVQHKREKRSVSGFLLPLQLYLNIAECVYLWVSLIHGHFRVCRVLATKTSLEVVVVVEKQHQR